MALARRPSVVHAAASFLTCALLCTGVSGCVRTVQAWPPPLASGTPVTVRFTARRSIAFEVEVGRDSVAVVRELQWHVVSLQGETLVVRITRIPEGTAAGRIVGRPATVVLDSATLVTRSEVDGWKVGYGILATAVLILRDLSCRAAECNSQAVLKNAEAGERSLLNCGSCAATSLKRSQLSSCVSPNRFAAEWVHPGEI